MLITLAGATFISPYFFLSALGGEMADRFDKAVVAQRLKLVEIAVAGIAVAGFTLHSIVAPPVGGPAPPCDPGAGTTDSALVRSLDWALDRALDWALYCAAAWRC